MYVDVIPIRKLKLKITRQILYFVDGVCMSGCVWFVISSANLTDRTCDQRYQIEVKLSGNIRKRITGSAFCIMQVTAIVTRDQDIAE